MIMGITRRIRAFFILMKADKELKKAINKADKLNLENGIRYYVIPDYRHELKVYSWSDIKRMRKSGMFSNRATQTDFIMESFYYTPDCFGGGKLTRMQMKGKRRAWLNYVAQVRRLIL